MMTIKAVLSTEVESREVVGSVVSSIWSRLETKLVVVVELSSVLSTEVESRVVGSVVSSIWSRLETTELVWLVEMTSAVSSEVKCQN